MSDSFPTPWSDPTSSSFSPYDERTPVETTDHTGRELRGKWLPVLLVSIYFLSLWNPPFLPIPYLRWYMVLGLGIVAFLAQGSRLDMHAASPLWVVYGLSFAGALISLMRSPNFDLSLWNTVGFGVSLITSLLFLPVLATRLARRILLIVLIGTALIWVIEIQQLAQTYGTLYYSTFGVTGSNKNHIGFCLAMAGTAVFYLTAFWKPSFLKSNLLLWTMRLVMCLVGIILFYNLSLIYARVGLMTAAAGIGSVLVVLWIKSPSRGSGVARVGIAATLIIITIMYLLPQVLTVAPHWERMADRVENQGVNAFSMREELIRKGWYLVSQNPILGVGIGGTRPAIYSDEIFHIALIHNLYLTEWAEKGILGLLSYVVWFIVYFNFTRKKFLSVPIADQIWLILVIILFIEMLFKDLSSISFMMLAIFSGIYYEQHLLDQTKPEHPVSPYLGV